MYGGATSGESRFVDYLDASDDVFFIASGEVKVTIYAHTGKAVSFSTMGPGEVFGEYPAIDQGPPFCKRRGSDKLPRSVFARRGFQRAPAN